MALDPMRMTHRELRATLLRVMLGAEETEAALRAELVVERCENERLGSEVEVLTDRVARLEARVEVLLLENARLRGGVSGGKESLNSSMPPGGDGPIVRSARAKKRSLREGSGKSLVVNRAIPGLVLHARSLMRSWSMFLGRVRGVVTCLPARTGWWGL